MILGTNTVELLLKELSRISALIGANPMLAQGAGGNTSLKIGCTLLVKASGIWLEHARSRNIFASLDLAGVRGLIDANSDKGMERCITDAQSTLRPSIETTLHALMPQSAVLHCHSVRTLAFATRTDATLLFRKRLDGLNWAIVPYCRPGMPLTLAVREVLRTKIPDILILANHGLVIAAESCVEAETLLNEVEQRLDAPMRDFIAPELDLLSAMSVNSRYRLPLYEISHSLATNPISAKIAVGGSLYPDHVVFLGRSAFCINSDNELTSASVAAGLPPLILVSGCGVLVRSDISANAEEMVRALALVVGHISDEAPMRYLTPEEESDLLEWDAEKYRKSLAANN